ncbi:MAG: hypothetical protein PHO40_01175 [Candidatus Omnitrophica bacterium]|jgi:hypothetical protein|nr:hypothetical protein [Candidatus Omnitrophota bacterium]
MNKTCNLVVLVFAIIICISFFLPWVSIESRIAGGISKFFTGERQSSFKTVSGFQVPILANGPDAKLMISIIKLFNPGVTDADKKSWLIWGIPGLAVALVLLVLSLGKNKWVNLGIGILGVAIFSGATYQIAKTNLDKFVMHVVITAGLWLILWSYLGIGLVSLFRFSRQLLPKIKE